MKDFYFEVTQLLPIIYKLPLLQYFIITSKKVISYNNLAMITVSH